MIFVVNGGGKEEKVRIDRLRIVGGDGREEGVMGS